MQATALRNSDNKVYTRSERNGLAPDVSHRHKHRLGRETLSMVAGRRFSMIAKFYELTGASDFEISNILGGISRSTVQAYRTERLPENLSEEQKERLIKAAQHYRQQVYEMVAELELYS